MQFSSYLRYLLAHAFKKFEKKILGMLIRGSDLLNESHTPEILNDNPASIDLLRAFGIRIGLIS